MRAALVVIGLCLAACFLIPPDLSQFSSARALPTPQFPGGTIYCASDDGRRNYCQADIRGGVQLTKQRSGSPCTFGQTWGYDTRGIWVDRGCRAEFTIGYTGGPGNGGPGWSGWGQAYNVYCASDDGRRNNCPVNTRGGVRLVRQRSGSPCTWGSTWGYDKHGIWVDRGCRADFEIGQAGWQPDQKRTIYCASDDMKRNVCNANTGQGVRIVRQRSESDCIYNRTWGYNRGQIWVDRGCRADFEIGGHY